MPSEYLEADLVRDERRENEAYLDTKGNVTWGIGHKDNSVAVGTHFTDPQIDAQFNIDVGVAESGIIRAFNPYVSLTPLRQDALINMAFNLGVAGLMEFESFLWYMKKGEYDAAANDLRTATKWYHEVGDRAVRIANQIETNIHQE